jgi:hypothetical protein
MKLYHFSEESNIQIFEPLLQLKEAILSSTVNFSMIRMRNAKLT